MTTISYSLVEVLPYRYELTRYKLTRYKLTRYKLTRFKLGKLGKKFYQPKFSHFLPIKSLIFQTLVAFFLFFLPQDLFTMKKFCLKISKLRLKTRIITYVMTHVKLLVDIKKVGIKKSALKKSALKKSALKKSALKKSALKKSALKKSALKKSVLKKSVLKKSVLKKSVLKKSVLKSRY